MPAHAATPALSPNGASARLTPQRPRGRPRKTLLERDDGNRRADLLRAAAALFRSQGFAATTTRDIAAASGMQSGSPFYHFKSKDALLFAVMQEGMHSALARQRDSLQAQHGQTALRQLRALVHTHFQVLLGSDSDFVPVMLYEARSLNAAQHSELSALQAEYEALWIPVLNQLHATGALRAPVGLARLLLLGALNWSVQWFDATKRATVADLTDAAMALFVGESTVST